MSAPAGSPAVSPVDHAPHSWRAVVVAMAQSGSGSVASGLLSAIGSKIMAAMLGPAGTALISTLAQTRDTAVIAATANGRTALIQGISAFDPIARREYLRTSLVIFTVGILAAAGLMIFAQDAVAAWAGLPTGTSGLLGWLAIPMALTSGFVVLSALANALGEIGRLAWSQVLVSAVAAVCAWPMARLVQGGLHEALDIWLGVTAASGFASGCWVIARHRMTVSNWLRGPGLWWSWTAARQFFSISIAMLATGLLSSVVLLGLRTRIIHAEGLEGAGWFDAAWTVSMRHVTLVLSSLQTFYLPALARAPDVAERAAQIGRVLMVTTLVMAPVVAILEMAKPLALTLLYSDSFQPAASLLRWTLVGDYLKVTSWVLAMPMLAVADMRAFLATDLMVQTVFVVSAILLGRMFKPSGGAAMAFVASYAVNLAICYWYSRCRHEFRPTRALTLAWSGGLVLVVGAALVS